jgi:HK97 gp10 family phage protein
MVKGVSVKVVGLAQAVDNLKTLEVKLQNKVIRAAIRRGLSVALREVKQTVYTRVQRRTGLLPRSMGVRLQRINKKRPFINAIITAKEVRGGRTQRLTGQVGDDDRKYAAFYWRFIEFGTAERRTKRGAHRGVMPATPFAGPAARARFSSIVDTTKEQLYLELDKEIAKLSKGPTI